MQAKQAEFLWSSSEAAASGLNIERLKHKPWGTSEVGLPPSPQLPRQSAIRGKEHPSGEEGDPWREVERSRILTQSETRTELSHEEVSPMGGRVQAAAGSQHCGVPKGVALLFIRSTTQGKFLCHSVPWFPCL